MSPPSHPALHDPSPALLVPSSSCRALYAGLTGRLLLQATTEKHDSAVHAYYTASEALRAAKSSGSEAPSHLLEARVARAEATRQRMEAALSRAKALLQFMDELMGACEEAEEDVSDRLNALRPSHRPRKAINPASMVDKEAQAVADAEGARQAAGGAVKGAREALALCVEREGVAARRLMVAEEALGAAEDSDPDRLLDYTPLRNEVARARDELEAAEAATAEAQIKVWGRSLFRPSLV